MPFDASSDTSPEQENYFTIYDEVLLLCAALVAHKRNESPIIPAEPLQPDQLSRQVRTKLERAAKKAPKFLDVFSERIIFYVLQIAWQQAFAQGFAEQANLPLDIRNEFQKTVNDLTRNNPLLHPELRDLLLRAAWVIFFDAPQAVSSVVRAILTPEDVELVPANLAPQRSAAERAPAALLRWSAVLGIAAILMLLSFLAQNSLLNRFRDSVSEGLQPAGGKP